MRLWLVCGACRHGQPAAKPAGFRCHHQHRQVRIPGDVWVDAGIAADVAKLHHAGIDTFASCEGTPPQRRYIMLGDASQVERASVLLPTFEVEPAHGRYLPMLVKEAT